MIQTLKNSKSANQNENEVDTGVGSATTKNRLNKKGRNQQKNTDVKDKTY